MKRSAGVGAAASRAAVPLALLSKFVIGLYGPAFRDGAGVFAWFLVRGSRTPGPFAKVLDEDSPGPAPRESRVKGSSSVPDMPRRMPF